jgi:uncharacterized protein
MKRSIYHEGEIAVQARAGVRDMALRLGGGIRSLIPEAAREFILRQPIAVIGAMGQDDSLWASVLTGEPGFLRAVDDQTMQIDARLLEGDPLAAYVKDGAQVGLLIIELETRRRMRLNGVVDLVSDDGLLIRAEEVFSNCPKYIQAREWRKTENIKDVKNRTALRSTELSSEQRLWISEADTFFIASSHPKAGVDVSHRGGAPGFVRIKDGRELVWGDYQGNNMFQTLGNLTSNPKAGLLFIDFEHERTLHLSGAAEVIWDEAQAASLGGAGRIASFRVEQAVEIRDSLPLQWRLLGYSPYNPT